MEELIGGMVAGWGGSIDREAAEVLLKRGAKPFGDKFKLSRELPCGNNQIWAQNTQCVIGYDPTPKGDKLPENAPSIVTFVFRYEHVRN